MPKIWSPGGGGGSSGSAASTPAVSIGTLTVPTNVNLSTEGTTDWVDSNAVNAFYPSASNTGLLHLKVNGLGHIWRTLRFFAGGAAGVTIGLGTDAAFTKSSTASDDMFTAALSATTLTYVYTATGSQTGYGYSFSVPAKTTAQTLVLYAGVWSGAITIMATLADGTTTSTTLNSGANTPASRRIPIAFTGRDNADLLSVRVVLTTNHGTSPNVQFYCATLAAS